MGLGGGRLGGAAGRGGAGGGGPCWRGSGVGVGAGWACAELDDIDDCRVGTAEIMRSDILEPINLGSAELVTIDELVDTVEEIAGVEPRRRYYLDAPRASAGETPTTSASVSDSVGNRVLRSPSGLEKTYAWIYDELATSHGLARRPVVSG